MKIIVLSGSVRKESSNAALLRAVSRVAPVDVRVVLYAGLGDLPHFNPDLDDEDGVAPVEVRELRELLIGADGILISCPEYAHGVPGAFKNLLDWLVSTGELAGKPVALLNASPAGGQYAQAALLETLHMMNWNVVEETSHLEPFLRRRTVTELEDDEAIQILRDSVSAFVDAVTAR